MEKKRRPHNRVSLNLSESDYKILQEQSKKTGLAMSEWLRLIIQVFGISEQASQWTPEQGPLKFELGGYGFEFPVGYLMNVVKSFESNLETITSLNEEVYIGYTKTKQKPRIRRIKAYKEVI